MNQPQTAQLLNRDQPLDKLLQHSGHIWRASNIDCGFQQGTPSGYALLDQHLPGSGWPTDGLTELLYGKAGIGEFRLLSPALARLSRHQNRWLLWVAPPYIPYAPSLVKAGIDLSRVLIVNPATDEDTLWVLETALASQSCSAVLAWPKKLKDKHLRRLQVACKTGHCLGILNRHFNAVHNSSPAELRIQLYADVPSPLSEHSCMKLKILKRKGGWATDLLTIELGDHLNQITPDFSALTVKNTSIYDRPFTYIESSTVNRHALQ